MAACFSSESSNRGDGWQSSRHALRSPFSASPSPLGRLGRLRCRDGDWDCTPFSFFSVISPSLALSRRDARIKKKTKVVYDSAMSTCSIFQPHHDFLMTPIQSAIIPPTSNTVFALLNCSVNSPVLNL